MTKCTRLLPCFSGKLVSNPGSHSRFCLRIFFSSNATRQKLKIEFESMGMLGYVGGRKPGMCGDCRVASYFLQFMLFALFGCILQEDVGLLCWHNQHIGTECNALNEERTTCNTTMI